MTPARKPILTRKMWQRMALSYVIALPMIGYLFWHPPASHNILIQVAILLLIVTASRILARMILRTDE